MMEELKESNVRKTFTVLLKVLLGLAFFILGALAILRWWGSFLMIAKGCIGLFLLLAGIITLAAAKE
ncbi:MAG: hypothetical protein V1869_05220 [Candidatus Omnitrophota bacterium]